MTTSPQTHEAESTPPAPVWFVDLTAHRDGFDQRGQPHIVAGVEAAERNIEITDRLHEAGAAVALVGDVIAQNTPTPPAWSRLTITAFPHAEALHSLTSDPGFLALFDDHLTIAADLLHLTGSPVELPMTHRAPAFTEPANVLDVHFWELSTPDAVEELMSASAAIALGAGATREALLEVEHIVNGDHGDYGEVFVGRYPDLQTYQRVRSDPTWNDATARFEATLNAHHNVVVEPVINNLQAATQATAI